MWTAACCHSYAIASFRPNLVVAGPDLTPWYAAAAAAAAAACRCGAMLGRKRCWETAGPPPLVLPMDGGGGGGGRRVVLRRHY